MKHRRAIGICLCAFIVLISAFPARGQDYRDMRVAVCGKSKPLVFLDADGTPSGMYIDIMDELARIGGLDIEYVVFDRKKQAIESLERGEVDAVLGTLESDQTGNPLLACTSEIYSASMCLVAEKGKSDYILRHALTYGYSTAYEVGTSSFVRISQIRPSPILIMSNQDSLYEALRSGEADMVIAVRDCIQYRIREAGLSDAYTTAINYLSSVSYSILLKRSDELRLNTLNTCISSLRSGTEYARIIDKWIIDADLEDAQLRIRNLTYVMAIVFGAALVIVTAFLFFNKRLKQVVASKTSELKEKVDDLENAYVLRNKLMEHAYAANLVVRKDGAILLMNDVARQMVELPSDKEDIPTIEALPVIGELWNKASQAMTQPQLLTVRDGKGVRRTYRYQCHRTSVPDEFVLIVEDVTSEERKKTEILEENKSQALNRIIAGIAHEIKNPLTTIRNYAVLADEEGSDPEFMASFHEYVPREVDRISRMIQSLMDYTRPPKGHKEEVRVADIVDDCLSLAFIGSKKRISMRRDVDESLSLYTDKEQLRQALVNLLMNSIESVEEKLSGGAGPQDMYVKVSVYRCDGESVIEVRDTGVGMDEEQIRQCTDPFFTTKPQGHGMGLAITRMYLKENAGRLEVESVAGEHTTMKMVFAEVDHGDE